MWSRMAPNSLRFSIQCPLYLSSRNYEYLRVAVHRAKRFRTDPKTMGPSPSTKQCQTYDRSHVHAQQRFASRRRYSTRRGCNSRDFCAFRRHQFLSPSRQTEWAEGRIEPFCSSNPKNALYDVPGGELKVEPVGSSSVFSDRAIHASGGGNDRFSSEWEIIRIDSG